MEWGVKSDADYEKQFRLECFDGGARVVLRKQENLQCLTVVKNGVALVRLASKEFKFPCPGPDAGVDEFSNKTLVPLLRGALA